MSADEWQEVKSRQALVGPESSKDHALRAARSRDSNAKLYAAQTELAVGFARRAGASWSEIGDMLGCSKQAAQQRYGRAASKMLDHYGPITPS